MEYQFYAGIGSRETPEEVCSLMTHIAETIERTQPQMILRSGGAFGADEAFERGVKDKWRKQIFLPWKKYNDNMSVFCNPTKDAMELAKEHHPAWARLSIGGQKLHARNGHIVLGLKLDLPVRFTLCYTPDGGDSGGTGQALRICRARGIPVYNLWREKTRANWEKWVINNV